MYAVGTLVVQDLTINLWRLRQDEIGPCQGVGASWTMVVGSRGRRNLCPRLQLQRGMQQGLPGRKILILSRLKVEKTDLSLTDWGSPAQCSIWNGQRSSFRGRYRRRGFSIAQCCVAVCAVDSGVRPNTNAKVHHSTILLIIAPILASLRSNNLKSELGVSKIPSQY